MDFPSNYGHLNFFQAIFTEFIYKPYWIEKWLIWSLFAFGWNEESNSTLAEPEYDVLFSFIIKLELIYIYFLIVDRNAREEWVLSSFAVRINVWWFWLHSVNACGLWFKRLITNIENENQRKRLSWTQRSISPTDKFEWDNTIWGNKMKR